MTKKETIKFTDGGMQDFSKKIIRITYIYQISLIILTFLVKNLVITSRLNGIPHWQEATPLGGRAAVLKNF